MQEFFKTSSQEIGVLIHGMGGLGKSTIAARLCDRLKFANKENPERFRQGFSQMLAVQYNPQADEAFERELRKVADDLVEDGLCTQLEKYLQQKQWKEADEGTAWIFYQVMVREKYKGWDELLRNFPCETL